MNSRNFFSIMGANNIPIQSTCGTRVPYDGGQQFPRDIIIDLGTGTGTATLFYDAYSIPDKFVVIFDGVEVINTGYRGDSSYQSTLDANLTARGVATETIAGTGSDSISFTKGTATTTALVRVYAPLPGTDWGFTLACAV